MPGPSSVLLKIDYRDKYEMERERETYLETDLIKGGLRDSTKNVNDENNMLVN